MCRALRIGDVDVAPAIALAPMAGVTDAAFRAQVRRFGAGLVVSEMVTAAAYLTGKPDVARKAQLTAQDVSGAASVQIAGRTPEEIFEAARRAAGEGAPIVDINMGCPAKKVTSGAAGAAILREPDLAERLIEAARRATDRPVTVKMRLGWDDASLTAPDVAARAERLGVAMVTVHARTRQQFYKGRADWRRARAVREAISIPMLINGDIDGPAAARTALAQSGADGIMIGRAASGRPWLLAEIAAALSGAEFAPPSRSQRVLLARAYYLDVVTALGERVGVRAARKHLIWRLEAAGLAPDAFAEARRAATRLEASADVADFLDRLAGRLADEDGATAGDAAERRAEAA